MNQIGLITSLFILFIAATSNAGSAGSCPSLAPKLLETVNDFVCQDLPIGQTVFVHHDHKESPTRLPTMYALNRVGDKKYRIEFNLDFIEHSTLRALKQTFAKGTENAFEQNMRKHVKKCMREYNDRLLGSNGEAIEFALIDPPRSDGPYRQIRADILISKENKFRSNSREYAHDADCTTVIHELLHLTGLADEYVETAKDRPSFDCRTYGMPNSAMNEGDRSFVNNLRAAHVVGYRCECTDAKICERSQPTAECNLPGFRRSEFNMNVEDSVLDKPELLAFVAAMPAMGQGFGMSKLPTKAYITKTTRFHEMPAGSLLYPAHFRAITRPGCHRENSKYYECARFAHESSSKSSVKPLNRDCPQKPAFCDDMTWLK